MSDAVFSQLEEAFQSQGADAAIDQLIQTLLDQKQYGTLFDAHLMRKKFQMGLPLTQPAFFDDVPDDKLDEFKEEYINRAREVGELYLADGDILNAWTYFGTIGEKGPIADALDQINSQRDLDEETEALIDVALYQGANPAKGLELMIRTHGTCNTVTAMDQHQQQMAPEDRQKAAKILVNELYNDLSHTLQMELQQKMVVLPPNASVREMIAGRDSLFADGNYHVDISHLNSIVRFARSLEEDCPELQKAIELAEYGAKLDPQFQYGGEPPFDDFYPAHIHFLQASAGQHLEEAISYFQTKLNQEPDEEDKPLLAYVVIDVLIRAKKHDQALELAEQYAEQLAQSAGFSYAQLCEEVGDVERLRTGAKQRGDLVNFTAALLKTTQTAE